MARLTAEAPRSVATPFESSVLRRLFVASVVVKVFLLIVAFDVTMTLAQPFDLTKAAVSRALLWPMVVLVALALARHGSGIVPRTSGDRDRLGERRAGRGWHLQLHRHQQQPAG